MFHILISIFQLRNINKLKPLQSCSRNMAIKYVDNNTCIYVNGSTTGDAIINGVIIIVFLRLKLNRPYLGVAIIIPSTYMN